MYQFLSFLLVTIIIGYGFGFLMNTTSETGPYGYQYLVGLIMDEKMSRYQLEARLSSIEQAYSEITKEIQKDRNNRQQLIDENTRLSLKLMNTAADLNKMESRFEKLLSDYNSLKGDFDNLTIAHRDLNEDTKSLTASQNLLEEKALNLTKGQDQLSNKYHTLLEQYLKVTSDNKDAYVDKQVFTTELKKFDNQLLVLDMNINVSVQIGQIRQEIKDKGIQLGFSLQKVNKTASTSDRLKFITSRLNTENMFNMSSGEFVCKRAGLYLFIATIVIEPGITESYCAMQVNGIALQWTVGHGSTTDGHTSGTTALVYQLNAGDKVTLGNCNGIDHMYWPSSFSGLLVVPD